MTVWVSKKEEEENINKKKLLYDGHGTGVDKRLLSILKEVTKFCLVDEPIDQIQNTYTQICEAINASIVDAERNEKILDVCRTVSRSDLTTSNAHVSSNQTDLIPSGSQHYMCSS